MKKLRVPGSQLHIRQYITDVYIVVHSLYTSFYYAWVHIHSTLFLHEFQLPRSNKILVNTNLFKVTQFQNNFLEKLSRPFKSLNSKLKKYSLHPIGVKLSRHESKI